MKRFSAKKITSAALSIALVCISTAIIHIPIPLGYMHLGNICILLYSYLFPWDIGLLAGGVGSALSDLLTGYPQWVLPTLIIKGIMGYAGSKITHAGKTPARMLSARTFIGALVSIVIMIAGYTIAGGIMYGSVATGLAQVPGLTTEGIIGIIGFYILGFVMEKCHVSKFISEGV
ncbi:ECF transporter S component [Mediterraneibacter sp. HCN-7094]